MFHYAIVGGLILLIIVAVVLMVMIRPEEDQRILPPDMKDTSDQTHFYRAINPKRPMPPVPPVKRTRHAAEPTTDVVYYGPVGGQPHTRQIPSMGRRR